MHRVILLVILAVACQVHTVSYDGYKTYRIWPINNEQVYLLDLLQNKPEFDFWTEASSFGRGVDIMVSPSKINFFETLLYNNHFNASILINNVANTLPTPEKQKNQHRDGSISFVEYNRYDTVKSYLLKLEKDYPQLASVFNIGKSSENRDILGIKISTGGSNKPAILIDAGIHAREWIAPATALYVIQQLVEVAKNSAYIKNVDWYIIPVLNPDGYEYTHTTDRFWRKTRSDGKICDGVDANRNFEFHWMEVGASSNECSETYAGRKPFSEPETDQLKNFALKINQDVKLYLTLHSYGQYLLYPWGFTSDYPENRAELQSLAESVNDAIKAVRGTRYTIGSSTNVLYPAAGGSDDWMMGIAKIPLSYTIELPGGGSGGFDPPPSYILPIVKETFEGVKVYQNYVGQKYKRS